MQAFHLLRNLIEPALPGALLCLVVAFIPLAHCRQHAHDLFFADFASTPVIVVWRRLEPRRASEITLPDKKSSGLGTTKALTAGIADERSAMLQVNVRYQRLLGGGIDKYGYAFGFGSRADGR